MDVNKVILMGHLGKDPVVRRWNNGGVSVLLSVATGKKWTDFKTGEEKGNTEWHNVELVNEKLTDLISQGARKGDKVYVEGVMEYKKIPYRDPKTKEKHEDKLVIFPKVKSWFVTVVAPKNPQQGGQSNRGSSQSNDHDYDDY